MKLCIKNVPRDQSVQAVLQAAVVAVAVAARRAAAAAARRAAVTRTRTRNEVMR